MTGQDFSAPAPDRPAPGFGPYAPGPEHSGFSAEQIDTSRPHPARMYDYYLGGRDNYEVDRAAAERVIEVHPQVRLSARANRAFLRRAVRELTAGGIRQILDVGTGIPTSPNTHEVARETAPDTRVVYVDNDPIVATHAGARLLDTDRTGFALADLRDPGAILDHPTVRDLIDFSQPVALLLVAVLHFISDDEDPAALVATLADALPAGSHLVLSHATDEPYEAYEGGRVDQTARAGVVDVYKSATAPLNLRTKAGIEPLFGPFTLLDPGVVRVPLWRPDGPVPGPQELNHTIFYAGVGRKG
ncbi:SAM-dependent methyltransferase [Streptomyces sp. NPDC001339]|uniref:SAM-dependent methyltransferase n=1 Tax=Streptomyces sp. NPDC001339 TaxID=3364563 RepID=UPI003679A14A